MPVSPSEMISLVLRQVMETAQVYGGVRSVLDIGIGDGFYGAALRRYFDHAGNRFGADAWQFRLVGVEGFDGFETPCWEYYDAVHKVMVQDYFKSHNERFDIILLLDVLDKMSAEEAMAILKDAYDRTDKCLIVSTASKPRAELEWGTDLMKQHNTYKPEAIVDRVTPRFRILHEWNDHWLAALFNEYLPVRGFDGA